MHARDDARLMPQSPNDDLDWCSLRREVGKIVAAIIASMPARYRDVYHLRHVKGYDASTVSRLLGVSVATVNWRDARTLHLIARVLAATRWGEIVRNGM